VIDPPWYLTREMVAALGIGVVAHGTEHDHNEDERDPYEVPKQMGIFVSLPSSRGGKNRLLDFTYRSICIYLSMYWYNDIYLLL